MSRLTPALLLEVFANALNLLSILLAGRNHLATWSTGIVGCVLFGFLFFISRLYADATLQLFFIATSVIGWIRWKSGAHGRALPIRRTPLRTIAFLTLGALAVTAGYGAMLHAFTDAYAPYIDSIVLTFSVLAQLLLMSRRLETWYFWLVVNTVAVPLYLSRGLMLTAILYAGFWINAWISLRHWKSLQRS